MRYNVNNHNIFYVYNNTNQTFRQSSSMGIVYSYRGACYAALYIIETARTHIIIYIYNTMTMIIIFCTKRGK